MKITTTTVQQTIQLGTLIGANIPPGQIIALYGDLGTGKTHLIKGIAQGLDIPNPDLITSPTFTLINEYHGRLTLYHIDAWRLQSAAQLEEIGFDELTSFNAVIAVEWADKVQSIIQTYHPLEITLRHAGPTQRKIQIENIPPILKTQLQQKITE